MKEYPQPSGRTYITEKATTAYGQPFERLMAVLDYNGRLMWKHSRYTEKGIAN